MARTNGNASVQLATTQPLGTITWTLPDHDTTRDLLLDLEGKIDAEAFALVKQYLQLQLYRQIEPTLVALGEQVATLCTSVHEGNFATALQDLEYETTVMYGGRFSLEHAARRQPVS